MACCNSAVDRIIKFDKIASNMNKRLFLFWGVLVAMVLVVSGGYWIWKTYFSYDPVKVYQEAEQKYIAAMTADTYGGKTPQETLDLFVEALRAGDVELASKYFTLNSDSNSEYYLTRNEYLASLAQLKNDDRLNDIAEIVSTATPDLNSILDENDYKFVARDNSGKLMAYINMQFNTLSQVWKIESL